MRGSQLTREKILLQAQELFRHNGVHATSLKDIADAAQIAKGTLFYHYAAKETLVLDIAQMHFNALTSRVYAWTDTLSPDMSAKQALLPLASTLFPDEKDKQLHFALLSEAMRAEGELVELVRAKHKEWAVILELGMLRISPPGRVKDFGKTVISIINSYCLSSLLCDGADISALILLLCESMTG